MTNVTTAAVKYFISHHNYFYRWEDGGDVLSIPAGKTICYKEYLLEVLEALQHQGMPSFGTLLLAIIATNAGGLEALAVVRDIFRSVERRFEDEDLVFDFLYTLSQMPPAYLEGRKRLQLFQVIFARSHNLMSGRRTKAMTHEFKQFESFSPVFFDTGDQSLEKVYQADLKQLHLLAEKYPTAESILQQMASMPELDDLPLTLEDPISETGSQDLISQLEQTPETFYVGILIRQIWSGLSIPFHSTHPAVQPLGGLSDLSNKGSFDKLLLSEFAHDDIVLLSRLANGEALYMNREVKPETSNLHRMLLIDSSLQTWGTPRTLAYALAIAIANHPKTDISCMAYAVGKSYKPVYFSSIHELISSLYLLDISLHAADGATAFLKESLPEGKHELFFITSPEGMQQGAVQKMLSDYSPEISYCITADEEGAVEVYKGKGAGLKLLQKFNLPLQALWKDPPSKKKESNEVTAATPGSSFHPILYPHPSGIKKTMTTGDGHTFVVTEENALMQKANISFQWYLKGWIHVLGKVPLSSQYELGKTTSGDYLFLYYLLDKKEVCIHNLTNGVAARIAFDKRRGAAKYNEFLFWHDHFLLIHHDGYWKFSVVYDRDKMTAVIEVEKKTNETNPRMLEAYSARQAALTALPAHRDASGSYLKNLKHVFIAQNGSIIINGHELRNYKDQEFRFMVNGSQPEDIVASTIHNTATFADGSRIKLSRNGMLVFQSSKKDIPAIYVPSVLGSALGMATYSHYAGADYFRPADLDADRILTAKEFYSRFITDFIVHIHLHAIKA